MGNDISGLGSVAELAKSVVDRFFPPQMSGSEKAEYQLKLQEMLQSRENAVIEAQKSIIVSEMQQADPYTKRARPTLVYAGLVFIFLVHVFFPIISFFTSQEVPALTLPEEFWWAWSGVCGIWMIGRSAEKLGNAGKAIGIITGNK